MFSYLEFWVKLVTFPLFEDSDLLSSIRNCLMEQRGILAKQDHFKELRAMVLKYQIQELNNEGWTSYGMSLNPVFKHRKVVSHFHLLHPLKLQMYLLYEFKKRREQTESRECPRKEADLAERAMKSQ